jgi:hypothetical protein
MAHANWEDAMVVAMTRDDKLLLRRNFVRSDQLPAKSEKARGSARREKFISGQTAGRGIARLPRFLIVCVPGEWSKSVSWLNREELLFQLRNNAETIGRSPCYNSISPERFTSRLML